jgi:hypothetical protein
MADDQGAGVNRKDALMTQAIFAFAQGCGDVHISEEACAWFHERYYAWIDKPKQSPETQGQSSQDVWDTEGPGFLAQFKEIGKRAASGGGTITKDTLEKEALAVEMLAACPWCPDEP